MSGHHHHLCRGDLRVADHRINIIDTPGHIDFNIEVNRSLRVLDGAIFIIEGVAGVQPQSETNWRLADRYNVPRIIFINKLDRTGADFFRAFATLKEKLDIVALPLQLPIGIEDKFLGVVDLVEMHAVVWEGAELGAKYHNEPIPADIAEQAKEYASSCWTPRCRSMTRRWRNTSTRATSGLRH